MNNNMHQREDIEFDARRGKIRYSTPSDSPFSKRYYTIWCLSLAVGCPFAGILGVLANPYLGVMVFIAFSIVGYVLFKMFTNEMIRSATVVDETFPVLKSSTIEEHEIDRQIAENVRKIFP